MTYTPPKRSDGTFRDFREKLPWPKDKPFRILSLDGGGIRGLFGAAYLAEIEKRYLNGASIGSYFDMVAGTSTGGIIALGLATGLPPACRRPKSRKSTRNGASSSFRRRNG